MYTINLFALTANIFKMFCTNVVKKIIFICGIEIMSFYCAPQWSILFFAPLLDVSKPWMPTFRGLGWDGAYQDYMSCLVIWCGATMLRRRTQVWRALIKRWVCLTKTYNCSKNLVMQRYKKILIDDQQSLWNSGPMVYFFGYYLLPTGNYESMMTSQFLEFVNNKIQFYTLAFCTWVL